MSPWKNIKMSLINFLKNGNLVQFLQNEILPEKEIYELTPTGKKKEIWISRNSDDSKLLLRNLRTPATRIVRATFPIINTFHEIMRRVSNIVAGRHQANFFQIVKEFGRELLFRLPRITFEPLYQLFSFFYETYIDFMYGNWKKKIFIVISAGTISLWSISLSQTITQSEHVENPYENPAYESGTGLLMNIQKSQKDSNMFNIMKALLKNPMETLYEHPINILNFMRMYKENSLILQNTSNGIKDDLNKFAISIVEEAEKIKDEEKKAEFCDDVIKVVDSLLQNGSDDGKLRIKLMEHGTNEPDLVRDLFFLLNNVHYALVGIMIKMKDPSVYNHTDSTTSLMYDLFTTHKLKEENMLAILASNINISLNESFKKIDFKKLKDDISNLDSLESALEFPFPNVTSLEPLKIVIEHELFNQIFNNYVTKSFSEEYLQTLIRYADNLGIPTDTLSFINLIGQSQMELYTYSGAALKSIGTTITGSISDYFKSIDLSHTNLLGTLGTAVTTGATIYTMGPGGGLTVATKFLSWGAMKGAATQILNMMTTICKEISSSKEVKAATVDFIFQKGVEKYFENNQQAKKMLTDWQLQETIKIMGRVGIHIYNNNRLSLDTTSSENFGKSLLTKLNDPKSLEVIQELILAGFFSIHIPVRDTTKSKEVTEYKESDDPNYNTEIFLNLMYTSNFAMGSVAYPLYQYGSDAIKYANSVLAINMMLELIKVLAQIGMYKMLGIKVQDNSPRRRISFDNANVENQILGKNLRILLQLLYPIIDCDNMWPVRIVSKINDIKKEEDKKEFKILQIICTMLYNLNRSRALIGSYSDWVDEMSIDLQKISMHVKEADLFLNEPGFNLFKIPTSNENFIQEDDVIGIHQDTRTTSVLRCVDENNTKYGKKEFPQDGDIDIIKNRYPLQAQDPNLPKKNIITRYGRQLIFQHKIRSILNPVKYVFRHPNMEENKSYYLSGVLISKQNIVWSRIKGKWYKYDDSDEIKEISSKPNIIAGDECFLLYICKITYKYVPSDFSDINAPKNPNVQDVFNNYINGMKLAVSEKLSSRKYSIVSYKGAEHKFDHINLCTVTAYVITKYINMAVNDQTKIEKDINVLKGKIANHFLTLERSVFERLDKPEGKLKAYICTDDAGNEAERLYCTDQLLVIQTIADLENATIILYSPEFYNNERVFSPQSRLKMSNDAPPVRMGFIKPTLLWTTSHFFPVILTHSGETYSENIGSFNCFEIETIADEDHKNIQPIASSDSKKRWFSFFTELFSNSTPKLGERFLKKNKPGPDREAQKTWGETFKDALNTKTNPNVTIHENDDPRPYL